MSSEVKSFNRKVVSLETLEYSCWYLWKPINWNWQFVVFTIGFSSQVKKLETKMATMNEDKDKRIVELQAHNNDLFNKLEEFEERYNNQLDVSRWLIVVKNMLYNMLYLHQQLWTMRVKDLIVIYAFWHFSSQSPERWCLGEPAVEDNCSQAGSSRLTKLPFQKIYRPALLQP